ncbi:hypothetical protein LOK49_LG02G02320 [Camellia lanceoleosa]|uniref:Uncharacterized protein n=1 Tax=Camellia lanceoleosa TaxID=1840588 RepID=A0ACC0IRH7_9ERIC|nr:hypothetical protein LOK49_LG02G02320 [Camellia lanceoleosa]
MGVPIHLRGKDVYRAIGDRCGGYVEADESSVDLGYVRLRSRSSHGTLARVVVRWGRWQFSLPVWVEEGPLVEPAVPEVVRGGGGGTDKDGQDLLQSVRSQWRNLGVNDYLQRFGPTTGNKGGRGHSFELTPMGLNRVLHRGHLGFAKVQTKRTVGLPKPKWAKVQGATRTGPSHGTLFTHRRNEGAPPVEARANPLLSRVFSSLKAGLRPRPVHRSLSVVRNLMGVAERVATGPSPSSGGVVAGSSPAVCVSRGNAESELTCPPLLPVVDVPSVIEGVEWHGDDVTEQPIGDDNLQQPVGDVNRWSVMLDELAMVVRPEAGSDEVAVEIGVHEEFGSDEVELESGTVGSDGAIPVPEEVSAWVLS